MTLLDDRPDPAPRGSPPRRCSRAAALRFLRSAALFGVAVVLGLGAVWFGLRLFAPHAYAGTVFPTGSPAAPLDGLVYDDGRPVDLDAYEGRAVMIYFGYTNCPDVCPTSLSVAAEAMDALGDDADDVAFMMISVDPARDELGMLGDYVRQFDERFVGVGGSVDAITDAAALYGVFFQCGEPGDDGEYVVDHTSTLIGIDPHGDLKVLWDPNITADRLAEDLPRHGVLEPDVR